MRLGTSPSIDSEWRRRVLDAESISVYHTNETDLWALYDPVASERDKADGHGLYWLGAHKSRRRALRHAEMLMRVVGSIRWTKNGLRRHAERLSKRRSQLWGVVGRT